MSNNFKIYELRYDQICKNSPSSCNVTFHIDQELKGKIAILYKLSGFYQNHRRIFNSKNYEQLGGKYISKYSDLSSCSPAISKEDSTDPKDIFIPCGLMAASFFTDYYKWMNTSVANFSEERISQISERNLYKPINSEYKSGIRILSNNSNFPGETINEHFIVWMRAAAMPDFLKIFAKCDNCILRKGDYQIEIKMKYPESMFHGKRYIYLASSGTLGNYSSFLWMSFIVCGGCSLFISIVFVILNLIHINIFKRNKQRRDNADIQDSINEILLNNNQNEIQLQTISENNYKNNLQT